MAEQTKDPVMQFLVSIDINKFGKLNKLCLTETSWQATAKRGSHICMNPLITEGNYFKCFLYRYAGL